MMVVSCPCAFIISTPVSMVSAITSATHHGVLIKGRDYIEEMKEIKAVVFDKTGTLTEAKLEVSDIKLINTQQYNKNDLIKIASSLESYSSHPIGKAIIDYANKNSINVDEVTDFKNIPGKGIVGYINGNEYYAANESLIEDSKNISLEELNNYSKDGKTIIFIGDKNGLISIITVFDKIRNESKDVIKRLNNKNIETIMLTGDNNIAARNVSEKIGINYTYSNLLPEDKLNILDIIHNKFGDVAMIGDGINDAPALARSDVGISMGAVGSDVAIETSDIALMQDDLTKVPYLFNLSHKTMEIIKENVTTAITVKTLFAILAIFGFISLWVAVGIGDMGLTLLVILNSFRLGSNNI